MKKFNYYILRPLIIIITVSLVFAYINNSYDATKWSMLARILHIITLLFFFIVTDKNDYKTH